MTTGQEKRTRETCTRLMFNRRTMMGASLAVASTLPAPSVAALEVCTRASVTDTGPFLPQGEIAERWDLVGAPSPAGQILEVVGVVRDANCMPVPGLVVTYWQADARGRYDHPNAQNDGPLEPGFAYFGRQRTGADGAYRIRTILPAPYQFMGLRRAPHIHFTFAHADSAPLVTELYFDTPEDAARRNGDQVWASRDPSTRDSMIQELRTNGGGAAVDQGGGSLWCRYDIAMPS